MSGGRLPLMEPEEARWVRPTPPPDEPFHRPFGGERLAAIPRFFAALDGVLLAGIVFVGFLLLLRLHIL